MQDLCIEVERGTALGEQIMEGEANNLALVEYLAVAGKLLIAATRATPPPIPEFLPRR